MPCPTHSFTEHKAVFSAGENNGLGRAKQCFPNQTVNTIIPPSCLSLVSLQVIELFPSLARYSSTQQNVAYRAVRKQLQFRIEAQVRIQLLGNHTQTENLT